MAFHRQTRLSHTGTWDFTASRKTKFVQTPSLAWKVIARSIQDRQQSHRSFSERYRRPSKGESQVSSPAYIDNIGQILRCLTALVWSVWSLDPIQSWKSSFCLVPLPLVFGRVRFPFFLREAHLPPPKNYLTSIAHSCSYTYWRISFISSIWLLMGGNVTMQSVPRVKICSWRSHPSCCAVILTYQMRKMACSDHESMCFISRTCCVVSLLCFVDSEDHVRSKHSFE
jgi:hypothetical protein